MRLLTRSREKLAAIAGEAATRVEIVQGDLNDAASLAGFVEPGGTVVNLAYLAGRGDEVNAAACRRLVEACRASNGARFIHCSTAVVVGRASSDVVTEETPCAPVTAYAKTKLLLERTVIDAADGHFDVAVVRPSAVFGAGGRNLEKLCADLMHGNRIKNYLRSCVFGRRRMNHVSVESVVAGIAFIIGCEQPLRSGCFFLSDDDAASNNFRDMERLLMRALAVDDYACAPIPLPPMLLRAALVWLGKDVVNPHRVYDPAKLAGLGHTAPIAFDAAVDAYGMWYRASHAGA